MDKQNGLSKQNSIFLNFYKNEKKMKMFLLLIIIIVIISSSLLSLAFSYKSYNKIKKYMNEYNDKEYESLSYETLIVSYSNGSLLICNENGCGSTTIHLENIGADNILCNIALVDVDGDNDNYNYFVNFDNKVISNKAPNNNIVVFDNIEIKPGEMKEYELSLNSTDGAIHGNYKMKLQINMDDDKSIFLE